MVSRRRRCWDAIKESGRPMTKVELAWAAGFIDGEGTFYTTKRQQVLTEKGYRTKAYPYFRLSVAQKDRRVLNKLKSIVGGAISGPFHYPPSKPYYMFCLCNAETVFKKLKPYLSDSKTGQ